MTGHAVSNLGPRQQLLRWVQALAAAVTAFGLLGVGVEPGAWLRAVAVVLVTLAAFCGLQAGHRTCAILAFAGQQNLDAGRRPVLDRSVRVTLRSRAWNIVWQALGVGAAATACAVLV